MKPIEILHQEIVHCRACADANFPIEPLPLVWGAAPAPFMVVGQAPGLTCMRGKRMYLGPAAKKLIGWLYDAGFTEQDIGTTIYMTALTKCYPGRLAGSSKDRAPSPKERALCRHWLDSQFQWVNPKVVILFGKIAIDTFLPKMTLDQAIGNVFEKDSLVWIPLPHSSGASTWLNDPTHRELTEQAIQQIRIQREKLLVQDALHDNQTLG